MGSKNTMDLRKIKTLIDLVEESGIAELEVKEGEESVRISRYPTGGMQPMPQYYAAPQAAMPAPAANVSSGITAAPVAPAPAGVIDPSAANNTASDTDTVNPVADLAITKTDGVASVNAGGSTTYTVTVTNNGPSVSRQPITVFDALPDGVAIQRVEERLSALGNVIACNDFELWWHRSNLSNCCANYNQSGRRFGNPIYNFRVHKNS